MARVAALLFGACALFALFPAAALEVAPVPPKPEAAAAEPASSEANEEARQKALCDLIETAASDHGLPIPFFTRLIWQESRFRSDAVSPKGAQGIAQFMPGTAAERELADPFDARSAIPASAGYLAHLRQRFGNIGLAAAAYNAGPERVGSWLRETATLPFETQNYVLSITGLAAEIWAGDENKPAPPAEPEEAEDCMALAALLRGPGASLAPEIESARAPWGVQVAGNFSKALALAAYSTLGKRFPAIIGNGPPMIVAGRVPGRGKRAFYRIRVPVETRAEGERLCTELKAAGASCIVLKS